MLVGSPDPGQASRADENMIRGYGIALHVLRESKIGLAHDLLTSYVRVTSLLDATPPPDRL